MRNNKILALTLSMLLASSTLLNTGLVFANNVDTTKKEMPKKIKNEILGKITSINATSVTIEVAERKEMEKPQDGQFPNGMPKEKPSDDWKQNKSEKPANDEMQGKTKKPNMDDMFTLTGSTKTINISSAEFDSGFRGRNADDQNKNNENNEKKKVKTYADYSVGDYISIELTDATSLTAKAVRDAGFGGSRFKRPDGEPPKKQ